MTGQIIAYGLFVAALAGLLILFLRDSWADEDADSVEDFQTFQRHLTPGAYHRPPASPRRSR